MTRGRLRKTGVRKVCGKNSKGRLKEERVVRGKRQLGDVQIGTGKGGPYD